MCKISLIIPVYNAGKYIGQLLNSIQKQKMEEIEVIFIDDGSVDNCPQILDEFVATDERYCVVHQENCGVCVARNVGLALSSGKYVYIIDADDWLEDNALEVLWNEAEHTNADLIYGAFYIEQNNVSTLKKYFPHSFCTENKQTIKKMQCAVNSNSAIYVKCPEFLIINGLGGAPWRAMIRRALIVDNGVLFDSDLNSLGEDIMFMQYIYEHVTRVAYIETPIYHYRMLTESLSHRYKENLLEIYEKVFEKEEQFLHDHKKDTEYWIAYYTCVITYISQSIKKYFQNRNNPKSKKELYQEFKKMIQTEPYSQAIKKVPLNIFVNYRRKVILLLLKGHMYRLFWILKSKFGNT